MSVETSVLLNEDNLTAMQAMPDGCIDLIYADPPFATGRDFVSFSDIWEAPTSGASDLVKLAEQVHSERMAGYLHYMEARVYEMHRILKPSGSIYMHCDPTCSYYLKILMDSVFGAKFFRREVVWAGGRISGRKIIANNWIRAHDTLLYYIGVDSTFNKMYESFADGYVSVRDKRRREQRAKAQQREIGKPISDVWTDIPSFQAKGNKDERTGYPTQKPEQLLLRIIYASSDKGDIVLDPFCGSGTTLVVAHRLQRRWIGIDKNPDAINLTQKRLVDIFGSNGNGNGNG